jgi:two-component system sensor histidine kinase/response regulator
MSTASSSRRAMGGPILVAVAFAAVAVFVALWFPRAARDAAEDALRHKAITQARLLAHSIAPAIDFGDTDAIEAAFAGAQTDADFVGAEVLDVDGHALSRRGSVSPSPSCVVAEVPVPIAGRGEARMVLALSTARIDAEGEQQRIVGGVLGATILLLGLLVAGWVARSIQRITALSEAHERERRRAEQANEVKSRFLANMSHEMRTPLNGVLGLAEVLSRRRIDPEAAAMVRAIARSGRTLLALVNDILDLSRVQAEQLHLEHAPFDPEAAAAAVCEMLQPQARTKSLDLALLVDESLPRQVVGDRLRFEQVLTNLVGNAVKFTGQGHVRVDLRQAEGLLRVEVRDTGAGIAADKLESIFDAFSQADSSTTRVFGGSGLGLTIARRLARLMGGDIVVTSAPGAGSTFVFTARAAPAEEADVRHTSSTELPRAARTFVICEHEASRAALVAAARALSGTVEVVSAELLCVRLEERATRELCVVLWDARVPAEARVSRMLRDPALGAGVRLVVISALGDLAVLSDVPHASLLAPFTRDAFARAVASEQSAGTVADDRPGVVLSAKLLVAEDDETNRLVIASYCAELGVRAQLVGDGVAALEHATGGSAYDIVLMDCQMPRMDGIEATRRIRAWEKAEGRAPLPIVAVTAHALPEERARAQAAGMSGYLTKPLTLDALRVALLEHVPAASRVLPRPSARPPALGPELSSHTPALRGELAASYRRGVDAGIDALSRAVAAGAWDEVAAQAHKLKGSSATVGARAVRDAAARLEALARGGGGPDASALVVELEVAAADALALLDEASSG